MGSDLCCMADDTRSGGWNDLLRDKGLGKASGQDGLGILCVTQRHGGDCAPLTPNLSSCGGLEGGMLDTW